MSVVHSLAPSAPGRAEIARRTADIYLRTGAVRFMEGRPFMFTSGWASPVYNDSRWLISFPQERDELMDFAVDTIAAGIGAGSIDAVAGGETAGIPFAAWVADRLRLPMQYVRKKPKDFGRGSQIEGRLLPGQRVLLVEDLTTDGRSKLDFVGALRDAGAVVEHCFVVFFYNVFPQARRVLADAGISMHWLTTWPDVLEAARSSGDFDPGVLREIEAFIADPAGWSSAHGGISGTKIPV
jgi:orotate phosphoribosyltransferase